jgi:hypothetical protein
MPTEADTCRKFVVPKLLAAGWDDEPHSIAEQRTITDGRIIPAGKGFIRKPPKRVDYLLRYPSLIRTTRGGQMERRGLVFLLIYEPSQAITATIGAT